MELILEIEDSISCYCLLLTCHRSPLASLWATIPISGDTRLCHFVSYNAVENEVRFMLECPLYNPIKDKFPSLFESVVPWGFKSFFQIDLWVDISLYLTEATVLRHSREVAGLKPSWHTFNIIILSIFSKFRSNLIPLINYEKPSNQLNLLYSHFSSTNYVHTLTNRMKAKTAPSAQPFS